MSYARMSEKEKVLADEVSALLAEAERIDKAEDAKFGTNRRRGGMRRPRAGTATTTSTRTPYPISDRGPARKPSGILPPVSWALTASGNMRSPLPKDTFSLLYTHMERTAASVLRSDCAIVAGKSRGHSRYAAMLEIAAPPPAMPPNRHCRPRTMRQPARRIGVSPARPAPPWS